MKRTLALAALAAVAATLAACRHHPHGFTQRDLVAPPFNAPGAQPGGAVLLPNQWFLHPVGKQIAVGDFPVNIALHPDGRFAAVLHCGYGPHEIVIIDLRDSRLISRASIDESFYGLAFSADGRALFASGAGDEVLHRFTFADGYLGGHATLKLREVKERGIPAGLAISRDGSTVVAANVLGHRVTFFDLAANKVAGEHLFATNATAQFTNRAALSEDEQAITKRALAALEDSRSDLPYPYACVLDEKRGRVYVSLWAQHAVAVLDIATRKLITRWATEDHPNEMLLSKSGQRLFVANANRNSVSVLDTATGRTVETLVAEVVPNALPGNTPNSLALSPDEKYLFVANANINTVAVFDLSNPARSTSLGFIPVGWYPTSVRVTPDGRKLVVANGKGLTSRSNRHGPAPGREPPGTVREYIAGLMQGTVSVIDLPAGEKFEAFMKTNTARAIACQPRTNSAFRAPHSALKNNPVPRSLGETSPIKYVFYVIKENRTYDQILGDMPEGNGDPSICLFPEKITPNHHALARDFVLLDNFYVESEVSADGHEWTMGAYASDFVEKSWPLSYGHNKRNKYGYPAEGNLPIATPAGGYLWDRAREAGVSFRSYGEFVANGKTTNDPCRTKVKALEGHFDPWFRSFDMDYPDQLRVDRFISELRRFEKEGDMPRLQIVRLPNDHTSGTAAGKPTPTAQVADNDLAFGRFVEAISRSKFWPQTAIFVVEDDAQNGSDHVDAHRTIAYAISPYTRRRGTDSTMYSTSSMLRTMELILGLKPMSQFDAAAMPMFNSFNAEPDPAPYTHRPVTVNLNERNKKNAPGAALSAKMDFTREDAADDIVLNDVIWKSVKGADSVMPAPRRAAFVFNHPKGDEDDD
jgi:DNA-binding beta-propeller fold protein YncE